MALVKKLVLITDIKARPELNGTIGLAKTFDDAKGRYAVRSMDHTRAQWLALKPDNLVDWVAAGVTRTATEAEIKAATTPARVLELMRTGCILPLDSHKRGRCTSATRGRLARTSMRPKPARSRRR